MFEMSCASSPMFSELTLQKLCLRPLGGLAHRTKSEGSLACSIPKDGFRKHLPGMLLLISFISKDCFAPYLLAITNLSLKPLLNLWLLRTVFEDLEKELNLFGLEASVLLLVTQLALWLLARIACCSARRPPFRGPRGEPRSEPDLRMLW